MSMTCREELSCHQLTLHHDNQMLFVKSQWPMPENVFLVWRFVWLLWNFTWMGISIVNETLHFSGEKWLIYLTNISYLMLVAHSALYFILVLQHKYRVFEQLQGKSDWEHSVLWLLTTVSFDMAIIVSALYWTLEFKGVWRVQSVVTHAVNSLYVVLDITIIAIPVRLLHVLYTIVCSIIYLCFTIVYHLLGGTNGLNEPYIYRALNWSNFKSSLVLSLIVVFVCVPVVHLLQFACYTFRMYVYGLTHKTAAPADMGDEERDAGAKVMDRDAGIKVVEMERLGGGVSREKERDPEVEMERESVVD